MKPMPRASEKNSIITAKVFVKPQFAESFADWQANFNAKIAAFPGFLSLEILSPNRTQPAWLIVQRFTDFESLSSWQKSKEREELMRELIPFLQEDLGSVEEVFSKETSHEGYVTEVFVTQVHPAYEEAYRKWIAKIHQAEAKFPGFSGVYVEAPTQGQGHNWITLLQFNTQENLDLWLSSSERKKVLEESSSLISSLESHRVISPYAGWFHTLAKEGVIPPVWKQTMLVLLVLFPIVMLELKYLSPLLLKFNMSMATFIGNAISVSLIAWPMMPIAIKYLGWWLAPKGNNPTKTTLHGTLLVCFLYVLEIALFWKLL